MVNETILNSYNAVELKRIIRATNITGYSKLKKNELIKLMLRDEHKERFKSVRHRDERQAKQIGSKQIKLKKSVLNSLKRKYPKYKEYIEFYEKSGFTKPKDLPAPPAWMLDGSLPPSNFKIPESIKKKLAAPASPAPAAPAAAPKPAAAAPAAAAPAADSIKVAKTIREKYPEYVKGVESLVKKGLLPNGGRMQRLRFENLLDISKGLDGDNDQAEISSLDYALNLLEDQDDDMHVFEFLFGKLNKKKLEKRYIDLTFFLLDVSNKDKIKLGRSALNDASLELQKKMLKKNRTKYLKFVSTMSDKTDEKQKEIDKTQ